MMKAIQIDRKDNVATVTSDVVSGEIVEVLSPEGSVLMVPKVVDDIEFGHKMALCSLGEGESIIKYGEVIGVASTLIKLGEWVHTHNVESIAVPISLSQGV
jgi:altronate dehydratase small subunit